MRSNRLSIELRPTLAIVAVILSVTSTLAATTWNEKVLHTFNGTDGAYSEASLIFDSAGNLYGTTAGGGNFTGKCSQLGCGTVFELSPNKSGGWTETVLYKFCSQIGCTDGFSPVGGLVMDTAGNLYGTTHMAAISVTTVRITRCRGAGRCSNCRPTGRAAGRERRCTPSAWRTVAPTGPTRRRA